MLPVQPLVLPGLLPVQPGREKLWAMDNLPVTDILLEQPAVVPGGVLQSIFIGRQQRLLCLWRHSSSCRSRKSPLRLLRARKWPKMCPYLCRKPTRAQKQPKTCPHLCREPIRAQKQPKMCQNRRSGNHNSNHSSSRSSRQASRQISNNYSNNYSSNSNNHSRNSSRSIRSNRNSCHSSRGMR